MSPEQAGGDAEVGPRSDIYALGAVAYYLLTGRPPFVAKNELQVLVAHARQPVTSPSVLRREVPEDLELVVLRCLAKSPNDRHPDCEQLAEALSACECAADWDQARAAEWWRGRS
jgi:serine/threonine-protein kinase